MSLLSFHWVSVRSARVLYSDVSDSHLPTLGLCSHRHCSQPTPEQRHHSGKRSVLLCTKHWAQRTARGTQCLSNTLLLPKGHALAKAVMATQQLVSVLTTAAINLQALRLLEAMWDVAGDISPDTVSYNALLKACGNAAEMRVAVQARRSRCRAYLSSTKGLKTLRKALALQITERLLAQVYQTMVARGVRPSIATFGTLITAASDTGDVAAVKQVSCIRL